MAHKHDDTIEILAPERHEELPPTIHQVRRRVFGLELLPVLFGALALTLVLALALLVSGYLVLAIVLLVLTAVLAAFVRTGVRRDSESRVARAWLRATDRLGSRLRLLEVSARGRVRPSRWSASGCG